MDPRLGVLPALADDHRHLAWREPQDEVTLDLADYSGVDGLDSDSDRNNHNSNC